MYRILTDTLKGKLSSVILTTTIIMVCTTTTIAVILLLLSLSLQGQHPQTAQASPCNGDNGKEYCTGYMLEQFRLINILRLETIWM
jgi:hypothetical protein